SAVNVACQWVASSCTRLVTVPWLAVMSASVKLLPGPSLNTKLTCDAGVPSLSDPATMSIATVGLTRSMSTVSELATRLELPDGSVNLLASTVNEPWPVKPPSAVTVACQWVASSCTRLVTVPWLAVMSAIVKLLPGPSLNTKLTCDAGVPSLSDPATMSIATVGLTRSLSTVSELATRLELPDGSVNLLASTVTEP